MKQMYVIAVSLAFLVLCPVTAEAQLLKKLQKKLEKKAEEAVEKQADRTIDGVLGEDPAEDGSSSTSTSKGHGPFKDLPKMSYDFVRGSETVFFDDFSNEAIGGMASRWTSNGTGSIETVEGRKWLKLFDNNTYKIKELVHIPENFTMEFDILTRSDKIGTVLDFGFDYKKGVGGHYYLAYKNPINVRIHYYHNHFTFNSNEVYPSKKSSINANMSYFVNSVMKVKIRVDGTRMRAYVDQYKVLDTEMTNPETKKYFYLAAGTNENRDGVYLGNFRITGGSPQVTSAQ